MIWSLAMVLLAADVPQDIVTGDPSVCGQWGGRERTNCYAELAEVDRAKEANRVCGREAMATGARLPRNVAAPAFARVFTAKVSRCHKQRTVCIELSLSFSKRFQLSDRMRVETSIEDCEVKFWDAFIERAGLEGQSLQQLRSANAPNP